MSCDVVTLQGRMTTRGVNIGKWTLGVTVRRNRGLFVIALLVGRT